MHRTGEGGTYEPRPRQRGDRAGDELPRHTHGRCKRWQVACCDVPIGLGKKAVVESSRPSADRVAEATSTDRGDLLSPPIRIFSADVHHRMPPNECRITRERRSGATGSNAASVTDTRRVHWQVRPRPR
jgi:hypothetical protein